MRTLIQNPDLKRIFTGSALAAVAGLAMGASVQPSLQDRILAPQQQMAGGGPRHYAAVNHAGIGAYAGAVPEYVIGTDYTRPPPPLEQEVLAYDDRARAVADYGETAEATAATPTHWVVEADDEPLYPSERGNDWNPSDLPEAPEPPVDTASPA